MTSSEGAPAVPAAAEVALLTGPTGVGKTTIAERVVGLARQSGLAVGGLLAPAMVDACGHKVGIWGVDLSTGGSERRILARTDRVLDGPQVGPYHFDASAVAWMRGAVEQAIDACHWSDCDLLIVDEIGKLELWQGGGLAPIVPRLAAGEVSRSLVVVRRALLAELQARLQPVRQVVFEADEATRERVPGRIVQWLNKAYNDEEANEQWQT